MNTEQARKEVERIVQELSPAEQSLLSRVIEAEQEKIHMSKAHGIVDALHKAVEDTIRF